MFVLDVDTNSVFLDLESTLFSQKIETKSLNHW